jgi:hypothetical protein
MGNFFSVYSVGDSIARFLKNTYPQNLRQTVACDFVQVSSGELAKKEALENKLTLYLFRVSMSEHLRNLTRPIAPNNRAVPLAVDLHYMLTVWSDSPQTEQVVMAWTMYQLFRHPVLDSSSLTPLAAWSKDETVQIIPAEMSNEDIMRIWESMALPYHLSVSYIARIVMIQDESIPDAAPVVSKRFSYEQKESGNGRA